MMRGKYWEVTDLASWFMDARGYPLAYASQHHGGWTVTFTESILRQLAGAGIATVASRKEAETYIVATLTLLEE